MRLSCPCTANCFLCSIDLIKLMYVLIQHVLYVTISSYYFFYFSLSILDEKKPLYFSKSSEALHFSQGSLRLFYKGTLFTWVLILLLFVYENHICRFYLWILLRLGFLRWTQTSDKGTFVFSFHLSMPLFLLGKKH